MGAESFKAAVEDLIAKVVGGKPLDAILTSCEQGVSSKE
jgi:hypothetical protein